MSQQTDKAPAGNLVLTMRLGESIYVGETIVVSLVSIWRHSVRLSVDFGGLLGPGSTPLSIRMPLRVDDSVNVRADIELTLVRIGDGQIRLGFRAPREMRIDRAPVRESIQRDGLQKRAG